MGKKKKPRQRRVRGTGTIFQHPTRGWVGRVVVGRKADGRVRYAERSASTPELLQKKLDRITPPSPGVTVAQWCARWLESVEGKRGATRDVYRNSVEKFIVPELGHVRLCDLTPFLVESACREWGRERASGTVALALANLRNALSAAQRAGVVAANAAALAKKPRVERKPARPFTRDELVAIIAEAALRYNTRVVGLLAATGLRLGEAIALDVGDYAAGTLSVTKTHHNVHGTGPPKSRVGIRTIRVPEVARPIVAAAVAKRKRGPLFASKVGTRFSRRSIAEAWEGLLKRLGLAVRGIHQLRHTSITLQLAAGYAPADVAKYHGNSVEVIMRTYCHPTGQDPSVGMDAVFSGGKPTKPRP